MSALGQKQTWRHVIGMSGIPPKADIRQQSRNVRFVPKADMPLTDDIWTICKLVEAALHGTIAAMGGKRHGRLTEIDGSAY
jgi:hypothetical protein